MARGSSKKLKYVRVLAVLSVLFLVLSILFHQQQYFPLYRALRGILCFAFLTVLFLYKGKLANKVVVFFLVLYGSSSLAAIWYEYDFMAILSMGLNLCAFLRLIVALIPKINFKKMNAFFIGIFGILVLVNSYLLYTFVQMIRDFTLNNLHYILIIIGAMSLAVTGFLSLLYNHKYSSKASLAFTLFVFVLIFAEVFRAIAYYDFAYGNLSVYIARGLLLLGISILIHYEMIEKKISEKLGNRQ